MTMNLPAVVALFIKQNLNVLLHDISEKNRSGIIGPNLQVLERQLEGVGSVDQAVASVLYKQALETVAYGYTLLSDVSTVKQRLNRTQHLHVFGSYVDVLEERDYRKKQYGDDLTIKNVLIIES